jgi:hypothetical protein
MQAASVWRGAAPPSSMCRQGEARHPCSTTYPPRQPFQFSPEMGESEARPRASFHWWLRHMMTPASTSTRPTCHHLQCGRVLCSLATPRRAMAVSLATCSSTPTTATWAPDVFDVKELCPRGNHKFSYYYNSCS